MGEPNFKNRTLYQGDNLEFLRGINTATIDLIATDPPFNKNKDFHATPDSLAAGARFEDRWAWDKDVHEEWVDAIKDNWRPVYEVIDAAKVASGMDMAAFLCWLGVRLIEMHRVLKPTGSIYLHIDHTAHAWTKTLMDAIFGRKNFRNEIVWCYAGGGQPVNDFPRKHDTILRYTKSKRFTFNRDAVRIPYDSDYAATVFAGSDTRAPGRTYKPDPRGKVVEDWWRNIPRPYGGERTGYPTQKPLELYERIIKASSNEDDVVLDPFCGCATTPVAAERLGRQWVGMDIWEGAHGVVLDRLRKEKDKNMAWKEGITPPVSPPPPERTPTRYPCQTCGWRYSVQSNPGRGSHTSRWSRCWPPRKYGTSGLPVRVAGAHWSCPSWSWTTSRPSPTGARTISSTAFFCAVLAMGRSATI